MALWRQALCEFKVSLFYKVSSRSKGPRTANEARRAGVEIRVGCVMVCVGIFKRCFLFFPTAEGKLNSILHQLSKGSQHSNQNNQSDW